MATPDTQAEALATGYWRFRVGMGTFVLAYAAWAIVPLAAVAGASPNSLATLTGAIVIGNKILVLACIAVMGKPGFQRLKALLFRHIRRLM